MGRMVMVLLAAVSAVVQAQGTVPRVAIGSGGVDVYTNRSMITGVHELPDGRVLVAQLGSSAILRLDLRSKKIDTVFTLQKLELPPQMEAMRAQVEAGSAGFFVSAPADRPAIVEISQRRVVFIDPAGGAPRLVPFGTTSPAAIPAFNPLGVDGQGRLYLTSSGVSMMPGNPSPVVADSVAVVRTRDGGAGVDTLRITTNPVKSMGPRVEQSMAAITMVSTSPDGRGRDSFTILRDGRVALIAGDDYRLRFIGVDKRETVSAPIATTPIPVTPQMITAAADSTKKMLDSALAQAKAMMASMMSEMPPEALAMMPPLSVRVDAPSSVAANLPAHSSIREAPGGLLWVTVPADLYHRVLHHDVLDASGALRARVTVPEGESLVAIGATSVYTIRLDAPMQARLRRYPLPATLQR